MRQIDPVLIRVGPQLPRQSTWQMVTKIYLPAMRAPIVNGVRLGLGVAIIGTLLAETKLSNRGIGFLIIQAYSTFDMPRMYALLIVLFVLCDRRQRAGRDGWAALDSIKRFLRNDGGTIMKRLAILAGALAALAIACAGPTTPSKLAIGQRGNWDTAVIPMSAIKAGIFKKHGSISS